MVQQEVHDMYWENVAQVRDEPRLCNDQDGNHHGDIIVFHKLSLILDALLKHLRR